MNKNLFEFKKTNHFMLSQWDRRIDDTLLYKVLPLISVSSEEKKLAILTPSFLLQKGISVKDKQCLVIVFNRKVLKTAFWCDHPNYLYKKEKEADFQWIY